METTKTNSVPEEQFNETNKNVENAANAAAKADESVENSAEKAVDFSNEEADAAANAEEFNLGDERLDAEKNSEVTINFSKLTRPELLAAFKKDIDEKPVDTIRNDVEAIKSAFYKITRQEQEAQKKAFLDAGNSIENYKPADDKNELEFKALFNQYKIKRSSYMRNLEGEKEENYKKKEALIEELKELVQKKENINLTFKEFKDIQQRWREIGPVPQAQMKDLWDTYNHHVENFYDYIKINKDLRDLDYKKNLEEKIKLCEKAEELLLEPSAITAFNKLQKYHEQWREVGPVSNEQREQIWERFKEATAKINKQHQEYFEKQKDEQEKNLQAKTALCEKAEELIPKTDVTTNKDWNELSKKLLDLQKIWKTIGFAPKKDNTRIYERFRKACDDFFGKKREFYGKFKQEMDDNYRKKIALCEKAEALAESTEWKKTAEQFIALQKQWKEIGVVSRKASNEVWKRFRAACDKFFNKRSSLNKEQEQKYEENLKQKQALIEEIKNYKSSADAEENLSSIKDFQRRWAEIGFVPFKEKERVQTEYRNAIDNLFSALNISEKDRKIAKFKTRLENLQSNKGQNKVLRSEREKLMSQIRQIESDIALWENNIGFFSKSKNADSMIAEVKRKIAKSREEAKLIEEKIKLLDES